MAKNENLTRAKAGKNDEFYTQFDDIQREMNAYLEFYPDVFLGKTVLLPCDDPAWSNFTKFFAMNFEFYGLKKLISTSYAAASRPNVPVRALSEADLANPSYDAELDPVHGRVYVLERDENGDGRIDLEDLRWSYLEGDGDFRSAEVTALRDEADFIITNPPFSLFREFLKWTTASRAKFALISNKNCVTFKEVFPMIRERRVWSGARSWSDFRFITPDRNNLPVAVPAIWLTNIDHGRRHQPLDLQDMARNLQIHPKMRGKTAYDRYDNYDAIEVPATMAIPSDWDGPMGVPISFLDKYCPEQFDIIGATESEGKGFSRGLWDRKSGVAQALINNQRVYKRIFIRRIRP